jgi:hypothetical protein
MQVTLTPQAEELLREALARNPGCSPEEILEHALAQRMAHEAAPFATDPVRERLRKIPGVELPDEWPPHFENFEPLAIGRVPQSFVLSRMTGNNRFATPPTVA